MIFMRTRKNGNVSGILCGKDTKLLCEYIAITLKLLRNGVAVEDVRRAYATGIYLFDKERGSSSYDGGFTHGHRH